MHATVHRQGMRLHGTVASGAVVADWQGDLSATSLLLVLDLPPTPVQDGYALFADAIPELAQARIKGRFALHATLSLPSQALTLEPCLEGMAVQGLGAEQWAQACSACGEGLPALTLGADSLLVTGGERSPVRKLRELLYAVEMEQTLGKARILRLYLACARSPRDLDPGVRRHPCRWPARVSAIGHTDGFCPIDLSQRA